MEPSNQEGFQKTEKGPILKHLDPTKPFIVEVDASETGAGSVLSLWFGEKPKLHQMAFFSKKLLPAEQTYDIANHELLAVKLPLENWHHWLEGTAHPFINFTDLEYLKTAK